MKKYLKLLYIALFAMMSVSLTACGDDDDEPDGGSGGQGGSSTSYTFRANGTTYYYGIETFPELGIWEIGSGRIEDDYIALSAEGFEKQLSFSEYMDVHKGELNVNYIDIYILLKSFDFESAKKGDVLELEGRMVESTGVKYLWPTLQFVDRSARKDATYYWAPTKNDKVTFVSYKDDILTINVERMSFLLEYEKDGLPYQFDLNGTISFSMN